MKVKKLILLYSLFVMCFFVNSSYADSTLPSNSDETQTVMIANDLQLYKDNKLKNKNEIVSKSTMILIEKIKENIAYIKYDEKELYAKIEDIKLEDKSADKEENKKAEEENEIKISEQEIASGDVTEASAYMPVSFSVENEIKTATNEDAKAEYTNGQRLEALFTSYYPANTLLEGGFYDAMGKRLDPNSNTVAAPKEIPFGSLVQIEGTGTYLDGKIYTVRDRGGAIKKRGNQYQFDILSHNRTQAYAWGRRTGYVRVVRWGW